MQPQRHDSSPPRVFRYSLDWRFLLPIADPEKTLVAFEHDADFSQTLEQVGIPVANQVSLSDILKQENRSAHAFVLPFGLPANWVDAEPSSQVEFYRSIRSLIDSHGYLLLGFNNSWNFQMVTGSKYYTSVPRRAVAQLQDAGFKAVNLFGAMPNLRIPEYTFQLGPQVMLFVLRHRFKRKPALLKLLQGVARTIGTASFSNLMPCYFAVATV